MEMYIVVISTILTLIILVLSIVTISKGYGYKHKIDPPVDPSKYDYKNESNETYKNQNS